MGWIISLIFHKSVNILHFPDFFLSQMQENSKN
jgi:hypothetical protein